MILLKRIDHIVLTVKNPVASVDFYTNVLNMVELSFKNGNKKIKAVRFGNQRFHLHELGKELEPKALKVTPGSADICLITDSSISEVVKHLKSHHIEIEKGPIVIIGTLGKMKSVWFRDPDGNLIEISNYAMNNA